MTSDVHADLARLCAYLPKLRRFASGSDLDELDRVVEMARSGADTGGVLADLLVRLDVPDDAAPVREAMPSLPGIRSHTSTDVYVCPRSVCSRFWARRPGVPIPRCDLLAGALVREQA